MSVIAAAVGWFIHSRQKRPKDSDAEPEDDEDVYKRQVYNSFIIFDWKKKKGYKSDIRATCLLGFTMAVL